MTFDEIYDNNKIEEFHLERMNRHIKGVQKYLDIFANSDLNDFDKAELKELGRKHDRDKLEGELFEQYKYISWLYHCKLEKISCNIPYTPEMDRATVRHIITNPHHPEYWDLDLKPVAVTDFNNRDNTKLTSVNGERMDDIHIIEMCCDWKSTSLERGNTATSWAIRCKNDERYRFTDDQWHLIFSILKVLDEN